MTREKALAKVRGYLTDCLPLDNSDEIDEIIEALEQEPCEDAVSRSDVMALIERTNLKYISSFTRGISQKAFEDLLYGTLSLPPITPKGVTITDFADKCRECGREKVLDKIRAEIEQSYCTVNNDYDHGRNYGLYMATQIIDKYKEVDREYKESKWVKVEDELPELYREVWLSCRGYKKVVRGYLSPDYHKSWYVYDSECGYYNINNANAWMYVERPKPYKAEREVNDGRLDGRGTGED